MRHVIGAFAGLLLVCIAGWYIDSLAHREIEQMARLFAVVGGLALTTAVVTAAVYFVIVAIERIRMRRAERLQAERAANFSVTVADPGQQVYTHQVSNTRLHIISQPLHLSPGRSNGAIEFDRSEAERWGYYNNLHATRTTRPQVVQPQALELPAGEAARPDLLTILDTAQCALIVGQRDSGKTTLLLHVISRRLAFSHVLVLDPHTWPGRWPDGCQVIGAERNFAAIGRALRALENLMNQRYKEIGKGLVKEGDHEQVTVVIDEWRAIVHQLGRDAGDIIKTLLAESRKTNIDVFVGTHSERVKALGIEGEGDLKDGFVMVRLSINKATMQRSATVDYGEGEIDVILPGPYRPVALLGERAAILEESDLEAVKDRLDGEPENEAGFNERVIELFQAGETITGITKQMFGYKNQAKVVQIKDILTGAGLIR